MKVAGRVKQQYWPKREVTEVSCYMDGYHRAPYTA